MIVVDKVSKAFGSVQALDRVSFSAPDGRVTGLLGPNGAGKTTLLRILYTVLEPDQGSASIDGFDVVKNRLQAQQHMGVLPHSHGLYARLTPIEHMRYFGELRGMSANDIEKRGQELIELLDMHALAQRRVLGFSQGETVKVALARALIHDPANVLLDEPTTGLDVMSARRVRSMVKHLRDTGRCVLFSSHIMQEVAELCDDIVVVAQGRIIAQGTPQQLREQTAHDNLEDAFVALIGSDEGLFQ